MTQAQAIDPDDEGYRLTVPVLRELLRNLVAFRSFYEATGQDHLNGPDGEIYSLWDIESIVESLHVLPKRQHEAIELFLIRNMKEKDAAVSMGVSATNPVAMYATAGLNRLVEMVNSGELSRFRPQDVAD